MRTDFLISAACQGGQCYLSLYSNFDSFFDFVDRQSIGLKECSEAPYLICYLEHLFRFMSCFIWSVDRKQI